MKVDTKLWVAVHAAFTKLGYRLHDYGNGLSWTKASCRLYCEHIEEILTGFTHEDIPALLATEGNPECAQGYTRSLWAKLREVLEEVLHG